MAKKITPKKEVENKEPIKKPIKKITTPKAKVEPKIEEAKLKKSPIKKVETKTTTKPPVKKTVLKKEPEKKEVIVTKDEPEVNIPIIERAGFSKTKRFKEDKYERIASNAPKEKFAEMGRKVSEGLLEWSYYGVDSADGDKGYHFYLVLDNKKKK